MSTQQEKLARMAAMFATSDNKESRPSNYYRFYDMNFNETATVRLLPDANKNNPMEFTVEKLMHNLTINGERRSVPCMKMYDPNAECPICKVSSAFYKEEGKDSPNGKKYWRKKQHILQCLVIDDPLPANPETGENSEGKIRYLNFGFQLFSVIKEALTGGDLEALPWDVNEGYDFVIKKTQQGDNAKYDLGSKFVRKQSSLTEDEIALVEEESIDLSTLIPPQMDIEKLEAMLNASLTGEHYDDGYNSNTTASTPAAETPAATPAADPAPVAEQAAPVAAAEPAPAVETPASATPSAEELSLIHI